MRGIKDLHSSGTLTSPSKKNANTSSKLSSLNRQGHVRKTKYKKVNSFSVYHFYVFYWAY